MSKSNHKKKIANQQKRTQRWLAHRRRGGYSVEALAEIIKADRDNVWIEMTSEELGEWLREQMNEISHQTDQA